jgi:hypothetical protein
VTLLNYALDQIGQELTAANIPWSADSRAARAGIAMIDPPSVRVLGKNSYECTFPVYALVPPPADLNALRAALELCDSIILAVSSTPGGASPATYTNAGQEFPAMQVQVTITVIR